MRSYGVLVALLVVSACGSKDTPNTACVDGDVRCGKDCSATAPCPDGLYCNASAVCAKDCVPGMSLCPGGAACMAGGMCPKVTSSTLPGGQGGQRGGQGGATVGGKPGGSVGGASATCGNTTATPTRVMPTVILIVDQSGSMNEEFGTGSRWQSLRDSLIAEPSGLVTALQNQVSFGLALYSARAGDGPVEGTCPLITPVMPALSNRAAIAAVYSPAMPIDETPTGDSITAVVNQLVPTSFDPIATPYAFILATDGEPDSCANPNPDTDDEQNMAKQKVVDAVTAAYGRGIRTYVISVGTDLSQDHQRAVANAGVGHQAGTPDAMFWRAGDDKSLRDALTAIVGTQISCDVVLNGSVTGDACRGMVKLQGTPLTCNDPNGWSLIDAKHIRLAGTACQSFGSNSSALLEITFPCDVFLQ